MFRFFYLSCLQLISIYTKMSTKMIKSLVSKKPTLMWIDGKCVKIKQFKRKADTKRNAKEVAATEEVQKHEDTELNRSNNDDNFNNEFDMKVDDNGKLFISFQLPSIYYIKLRRFDEFNIEALSKKTGTDITVPNFAKDDKLTIAGPKEENIHEALKEIHSVIAEIRNRSTALQFISIPLVAAEIKSNFEKFKTEVLSETDIKGMDESIFQSAQKLHLTILVFALLDEREKQEAINALEDYNKSILSPLLEKTGPLKVHVAGIECMNNNYKKVDVLYAKAKIKDETEEANLQKIANDLSDYFYKRGLMKGYQENVKLHMTLINTKYRNVPESPKRRRWPKRESFDATKIMEKYKNYEFGECGFSSIHLSLMSSLGEDGFYESLSCIKM